MTMPSLSPPRGRRQSISQSISQDSVLVNCTLTYYYDKRYIAGNVHGEAARLALVLKGIPFKANRIKKKEIKDYKGSLPSLTLADGRTVTNKSALLRLVARETRLYSEDNFVAAEIDAFLDTIDELFEGAGLLQNASLKGDSENQAGLLQTMDGLLDPETGYAVGDKFTMADLVVYAITRSTYGVKKPPNKDTKNAMLDNILSVRKRVDGHIAMAKPSDDMDASFIEYQD